MKDGKLLLTCYEGRLLALLIRHNRLLSVKVYEEEKTSLVGNIYIGKVQSLAKGIEAAFIEIAEKEICFLPGENCKNPILLRRNYDGKLKPGDELLVQVEREKIKTKQPVVTTRISLAGNYLAVSAEERKTGISSKIPAEKKQQITDFLQEKGLLSAKKDISAVVRTNAQTLTEFAPLLQEWEILEKALRELLQIAPYRTVFTCLRKNETPYLEDLKNYYAGEYEEIVTDSEDLYKELLEYRATRQVSCGMALPPVRLYQDEYPLEKVYSIKTQLAEALAERVWLKSGGYLVIEPTEALTVIDVNTGKYETSRNQNKEDTFYAINSEAAGEIARQIRLRNLSGIIIVDFINMRAEEKQKLLLAQLKQFLMADPVKTAVVDITPLGLVEITRKRVNRPLRELLQKKKPDGFKSRREV